MKLYYAPQTRATRVRWLLEEPEVPYELERVNLSAGEQKSAAYRKIHPLGRVPALGRSSHGSTAATSRTGRRRPVGQ